MVGMAPASRTDFFGTGASVANGPAEVRLDFGNGEFILFRRADTYRYQPYIRYLIPTKHDFPSGYKQYFDYPDTGKYPSRIRDSFGRQITIDWTTVPSYDPSITYKVISGDKLVVDEGSPELVEGSRLQRWLGSASTGAGAPAPTARLRPSYA